MTNHKSKRDVMPCIICGLIEENAPIEHIVSHSLGNTVYVLDRGMLCTEHNRLFSRFEEKALTGTVLGMERARSGRRTKKGNPGKIKLDDLEISGDEGFRRDIVTIDTEKTDPRYMTPVDSGSKQFNILIPSFQETSSPMAKLLLKMGIESLAQSRKDIFARFDFTALKDHLTNVNNSDWPFVTSKVHKHQFISIPSKTIKYKLGIIRCQLLIAEGDSNTLLFNFRYGGLSMLINLLGRDLSWIKQYLTTIDYNELYPIHFRKKVR